MQLKQNISASLVSNYIMFISYFAQYRSNGARANWSGGGRKEGEQKKKGDTEQGVHTARNAENINWGEQKFVF